MALENRVIDADIHRANRGLIAGLVVALVFGAGSFVLVLSGYALVGGIIGAGDIVLDDTGDFRPGRRAAAQHGVRSPLVEAGLTKEDIRALSRQRGLPTWDKPAMACLSSRIPYGTPVTVEALGRIGDAEAYLRSLGLRQLRVRHHEDVARIETDEAGLELLIAHRAEVVERLKALGYLYVTLDLAGYRSGSLNAALGRRTT